MQALSGCEGKLMQLRKGQASTVKGQAHAVNVGKSRQLGESRGDS